MQILEIKAINGFPQKNERIYLPELDGLRFLAFLLVFIHHQNLLTQVKFFAALKEYGWVGVDMFFALSAFLFTRLLTTEYLITSKISLKKFYLRRIFRIWPIYFVFIGFSVAWLLLINHGETSKEIVIRLIGLFSFSDNILTAIKGFNPLPFTLHLWTIAYEEQFYIFIPFIILLLVRSTVRVKIITLISTYLLFAGMRHIMILNNIPHPAIYVLPVTHFESIILGMVVGFGGYEFLLKKINPLILGLIGILFLIFVCILPMPYNISNWLHVTYLCVGVFTSLVLFSVLNSTLLIRIFSISVFVFLGKRSYGLYVYHLLGNGVASTAINNIPAIPSNSAASFLYSLSFTILASIISYEIIEKPFLRLKKKFEVVISRPI
jgi:peptidoglycan/LPS O-acetylase OafA/YrhL